MKWTISVEVDEDVVAMMQDKDQQHLRKSLVEEVEGKLEDLASQLAEWEVFMVRKLGGPYKFSDAYHRFNIKARLVIEKD